MRQLCSDRATRADLLSAARAETGQLADISDMDGRNPGASEGARGSILVANADPSARELLAHALQQSGYDVTLAADGPEAILIEVDSDHAGSTSLRPEVK